MQRPSISLLTLLFLFLLLPAAWATTVKFRHQENENINLSDAAFPEVIEYQASMQFKNMTIFELPESSFYFLRIAVNEKSYYLWVTAKSVEIDLQNIHLEEFDDHFLLPSENWHQRIESQSPLKSIAEIDAYYEKALDSLYTKAKSDPKYRSSILFDEVVWDKPSAKRLYNFAIEHFSNQFDPYYLLYSSAYMAYWELMYKLYYQYFHTNSFKSLLPAEAFSRLSSDFPEEGLDALFLVHFFRYGTPQQELKENYEKFKHRISPRQLAYAKSQLFSERNSSSIHNVDFIFGIDIDASLQGFYAKDTSEKQNILIFWSIWDRQSERELLLLKEYHHAFHTAYNFIYICTDGGSQEEKAKALIYRDKIYGFHILPKNTDAFQKSLYKNSLKIRELPYFVLTDQAGNILASEELSLDVSHRLIKKLEHYAP